MSLRRYLRRRKWDEERARELEAHLAQETDDNVARGMTPDEARRRAYMKLGNPTVIREEIWKMNSFVSVEDLGRDVRYAFRQLRTEPGICGDRDGDAGAGNWGEHGDFQRGERAAVQLAAHPAGEPGAGDWVAAEGDGLAAELSLPEYEAIGREPDKRCFRRRGRVMQYGLDGLSMEGSKPDRAFTIYVTGNYFEMLGVEPLIWGGCSTRARAMTPGADPVMVLSYAYWKQHFAADPNVVGRQVLLDGHPMTVVGVTREGLSRGEHGADVRRRICRWR